MPSRGIKIGFWTVSRPLAGLGGPKMIPERSRTLPEGSQTPWDPDYLDFLAQIPILTLSRTRFGDKWRFGASTTFRAIHFSIFNLTSSSSLLTSSLSHFSYSRNLPSSSNFYTSLGNCPALKISFQLDVPCYVLRISQAYPKGYG